ncbi:hypothetical protein OS493_020486 [Desmophyllum pertusum]|uniref:Uncharacterized protein n=1 Tax=Desmophyllum pertusum TaxID=174260 RepID=A0A9W9ZCL9_9CNID|nr:hypothetical protein OS493_020486 [Desmophyllum pertusum]
MRTHLHWAAATTGHGPLWFAHLLRLESKQGCRRTNMVERHFNMLSRGHHTACCQLLIDHDPDNPLADRTRQTVLGDSEVQQILGSNGTATVQVLVEMNGQEESSTEADCLHPNINGESDAAGYSSEEDSRYPPQMALTPIPASPVPPEDVNHNNPTRPPILPRFSFEV